MNSYCLVAFVRIGDVMLCLQEFCGCALIALALKFDCQVSCSFDYIHKTYSDEVIKFDVHLCFSFTVCFDSADGLKLEHVFFFVRQ